MQHLDHALFLRAQSGDSVARDEIFSANTGLVWACIRKYVGLMEKEDLFQLGSIGLLKAIDRFDPSYGVVFSTFAVPHILGEVRRHLRDNALVKVDRRLREISYQARKVRQEMTAKSGREPTASEIAEALEVPVDVLLEALEAASSVLYLEDVPGYGDRSALDQDSPADEESVDLRAAVDRLEPEMRKIVEGRFFLARTQSEIARDLGISQAHVSRLEKKALLCLREYYRGK